MDRTTPLPLQGVTVLDLSWHLAGPYCSMILADLGARVIKVERPGANGGYDPGGVARHQYKGEDVHYIALNRNKRSIILDLKDPEDHAAFLTMVGKSDVVFNNFRPGTMDRLGLGFDALRAANPSIIFASLSAFGNTGPERMRPGVDLVVQAESAGMSMTGEPGQPPVRAGLPIADLAGGMWTAIAILAALRDRDQNGGGAKEIDTSLFDSHLAMIPYFTAYHTINGFTPGPQGSGGHSPTYGAFRTSDDRYVALAVIDQKPWKLLCEALETPELLADERFANAKSRIDHTPELRALVQKVVEKRTADEWMQRFLELGVPAGRVNELGETLQKPQVKARGMLVDIEHVLGGTIQLLGTPVHMTGYQPTFVSPPLIGQHTDEVLKEFGIERANPTHAGADSEGAL
ncbi:CaiB/BaiF CoA transferase family protein [Actinomadura alba]|uniref:CoA transferase n=1 Tax=Actinomadura alba TaxID=406431 RepID=A0ABR7LTH6_9ACTN|nr:CoA transferase [Actinomadura alba]MBC6468084.1 CoA transferase [Actinomadura alba]